MKNLIVALMLVLGFTSVSSAGDCADGVCRAPVQPVRKVVNITKNVVVAPVRAVVALSTPTSRHCETVVTNDCNSCCSEVSKTVTRYQPVRRRLVNRTTNVSNCGCQ